MVFSKFGEHPVDQAAVFIQVLREDQDIVQVDHYVDALYDCRPVA